MPRFPSLYRRPSGVYVVRLIVPARLRFLSSCAEIHASTHCKDLGEAKLKALQIQLHWRQKFREWEMDAAKLTPSSPLLTGAGLISIPAAADAIGLTVAQLLGELRARNVAVYVPTVGWRGWIVADLKRVDRDHDGTFIFNSVCAEGDQHTYSGLVRCLDGSAAIADLMNSGSFKAGSNIYVLPESGASFFLDWQDDRQVTSGACMVPKGAIERIRTHLADSLSHTPAAASMVSLELQKSIVVTPVSPVQKYAKMRFSELFEIMSRAKQGWKESTRRRKISEIGLFVELMNDPTLDSIDHPLIQLYADALARLPERPYDVKRAHNVSSLAEVMSIAATDGIPLKKQAAINTHVAHVGEVFSWAVQKRMMEFNAAAGFSDGFKKNQTPDQESRDVFSEEELKLIFSAPWFLSGSGDFTASGWTHWRPHYYWLPLLALYAGGRINELSQLYLADIVQDDGGFYFDFNLKNSDKIADRDELDKSFKTVNAIRKIPVHEHLIALGLVDYVAALRREGYVRLFPELTRDPIKGYGKPAGSWFNERFLGNTLGIPRDRKRTFHSLRHNFADKLDEFALAETSLAQLMGYVRGKTEGTRRYRKDKIAGPRRGIDQLEYAATEHVALFRVDDGLRSIKAAQAAKKRDSRSRRETLKALRQ